MFPQEFLAVCCCRCFWLQFVVQLCGSSLVQICRQWTPNTHDDTTQQPFTFSSKKPHKQSVGNVFAPSHTPHTNPHGTLVLFLLIEMSVAPQLQPYPTWLARIAVLRRFLLVLIGPHGPVRISFFGPLVAIPPGQREGPGRGKQHHDTDVQGPPVPSSRPG